MGANPVTHGFLKKKKKKPNILKLDRTEPKPSQNEIRSGLSQTLHRHKHLIDATTNEWQQPTERTRKEIARQIGPQT